MNGYRSKLINRRIIKYQKAAEIYGRIDKAKTVYLAV
jgi:hypothetical protein